MAIFTCCISSCCHFGRLRNSFTIKWYFVIEKTAKACNNSAYFFYIIGYNKINYNLQKKASLKILLGGHGPPCPPASPAPAKVSQPFQMRIGFLLPQNLFPRPALKELRNLILRTTLVWSLFCSIRVYVGQDFSTGSFRKLVFRLSVLSLN